MLAISVVLIPYVSSEFMNSDFMLHVCLVVFRFKMVLCMDNVVHILSPIVPYKLVLNTHQTFKSCREIFEG